MTILKKAIVIGASSGIGEELAKVLSNEGYIVGLVARRIDNLLALQKKLTHKSFGALMANPIAPAYNASKTFVSNYLISIRQKVKEAEGKRFSNRC